MDTSANRVDVGRRMMVAASAAWLGGLAAANRTANESYAGPISPAADHSGSPAPAAAEAPAGSQPASVADKPGPRGPWPQHSPTSPYVNAADFGLRPCSPERMSVEAFAQNPDATDALQRALDVGAAGRVFIPPGAYRVTRPLQVRTGTTVIGAGYCATMLLCEKPLPAILHLRKVSGPMTIVSDLWVAGPIGGNWGATGLWLDQSNGVTIRDCWVSALGTGIRVDGISDTWLRHIVYELNQHGIAVQCGELSWASGNLRLLDCYGYQNYQSGVTLTNCRGVQVHSCSATGSAHALLLRRCAQVSIGGTQVNFDGSPWRRFGIRLEQCEHVSLGQSVVEGMVQYGIAAVDCKHLSVQGNVIRNTTGGPGMILSGCEAGAIHGNSVSESAGDGMAVSAYRHLSISGNVIAVFGRNADKSKKDAARGLRIGADCVDCTDHANIVLPK